jgi:hypothetical protein
VKEKPEIQAAHDELERARAESGEEADAPKQLTD